MSQLALNLKHAAEYAVAKVAGVGLISIDDTGVEAIASAVVVEVLDECSLRIIDYREAADALRTPEGEKP